MTVILILVIAIICLFYFEVKDDFLWLWSILGISFYIFFWIWIEIFGSNLLAFIIAVILTFTIQSILMSEDFCGKSLLDDIIESVFDKINIFILSNKFNFSYPDEFTDMVSFTHKKKDKLPNTDIDLIMSIFYSETSIIYTKDFDSNNFLRIKIIFNPQLRGNLKAVKLYRITQTQYVLSNKEIIFFKNPFHKIEAFCDFPFATIKRDGFDLKRGKVKLELIFEKTVEELILNGRMRKVFNQSFRLSLSLAESHSFYEYWQSGQKNTIDN